MQQENTTEIISAIPTELLTKILKKIGKIGNIGNVRLVCTAFADIVNGFKKITISLDDITNNNSQYVIKQLCFENLNNLTIQIRGVNQIIILPHLPNLTHLCIDPQNKFHSDYIVVGLVHLKKLESLSINGCGNRHLDCNESLKHLNIDCCAYIKAILRFTKLQSVSMVMNSHITRIPESVKHLSCDDTTLINVAEYTGKITCYLNRRDILMRHPVMVYFGDIDLAGTESRLTRLDDINSQMRNGLRDGSGYKSIVNF